MYSKLWNCNRLWKIWYCILVTFLQFYVTYNSIRNYIIFKSQYYNPRYGGNWNIGPLHLYIGCIITSTSLMGFFIYFCVINIRNPSQTDIRSYLNIENPNPKDCYGPIPRLVSKLIRDKLPYAPLLHLLMALFLILPLPVVHMEQIRNEVLSPDSIWTMNFDFFTEHFSWSITDSLPKGFSMDNLHYITKTSVLSLEFINFITATILFLIQLPNVLWYCHKWFSILYSVIIFCNCINWLIIFEAGSIFIKSMSNVDSEMLKKTSNQMSYSTMLLFLGTHFILAILGFIAVFDYGQTQSAISWLRGFKTFSCFNQNDLKKTCWVGSVVAIGFFLLLITLIIDSIVFVSFFNYLQLFNKSIFLVAIIFGVFNLVLNFLVWFTFSIKNRWNFNLSIPGISANTNHIIDSSTKYTGSPDTIYGCFHNNITLSTSSSHSSGRGNGRTNDGSSADSACYGNNYQNYVYLQSPTTQIPTISEDYDENNTNTSKSSSINLNDNRNIDHEALYRTSTSISDNGLNKINDNMIADSYRSLQMINNRKSGKLVTFHDVNEEKLPFFNTYDKSFSNNNMDPLTFLKVPDILNVNRSTMSGSLSESSLDQISSSLSSKAAIEINDNGMCSEV